MKPSPIVESYGTTISHIFLMNAPFLYETECVTVDVADIGHGRVTRPLDSGAGCSLYVPMPVETLKDALSAGWRVHARCIDGKVGNTRSTAKCHYRAELDLETLVWTRGPHMSLAGLNDRMMCRAAATAASI